jgi:PAS domain-containing protein
MNAAVQAILQNAGALLDGDTGVSIHRRFPGSLERHLFWCNRTYARMAGRDREELLALGDMRPLQRRTHDRPVSKQFQTLVEEGRGWAGTFAWLRPDGLDNLVEYLALPAVHEHGTYVVGLDKFLLAPAVAAPGWDMDHGFSLAPRGGKG